eukprot:364712-Chlamydomonas_euryale.AAC.10
MCKQLGPERVQAVGARACASSWRSSVNGAVMHSPSLFLHAFADTAHQLGRADRRQRSAACARAARAVDELPGCGAGFVASAPGGALPGGRARDGRVRQNVLCAAQPRQLVAACDRRGPRFRGWIHGRPVT